MKEYNSPEMMLLEVSFADIITTSDVENNDSTEPGIELPEMIFPRNP